MDMLQHMFERALGSVRATTFGLARGVVKVEDLDASTSAHRRAVLAWSQQAGKKCPVSFVCGMCNWELVEAVFFGTEGEQKYPMWREMETEVATRLRTHMGTADNILREIFRAEASPRIPAALVDNLKIALTLCATGTWNTVRKHHHKTLPGLLTEVSSARGSDGNLDGSIPDAGLVDDIKEAALTSVCTGAPWPVIKGHTVDSKRPTVDSLERWCKYRGGNLDWSIPIEIPQDVFRALTVKAQVFLMSYACMEPSKVRFAAPFSQDEASSLLSLWASAGEKVPWCRILQIRKALTDGAKSDGRTPIRDVAKAEMVMQAVVADTDHQMGFFYSELLKDYLAWLETLPEAERCAASALFAKVVGGSSLLEFVLSERVITLSEETKRAVETLKIGRKPA